MLTWEEEVKPSTPLPHALGSPNSHPVDAAPPEFNTSTPRRVNAADKRIINGKTDVNQLVPF